MGSAMPLSELTQKIQHSGFGGSAEMVRATVQTLAACAAGSKAATREALGKELEGKVFEILRVTPSIAPRLNLFHRLMRAVEDAQASSEPVAEMRAGLAGTAQAYLIQQDSAIAAIGQVGAALIRDGDIIFTYSTSGTVASIFQEAHRQGKRFSVRVTESRPANEGHRTAQEVVDLGLPITVGIDAAMGLLIPGCSMFLVGADVITAGGSALCKVGTYPAALVARAHGVPFRIAADTSKFDPLTLLGFPLRVRQRTWTEVFPGISAEKKSILGNTFDVTPSHLITELVTERGIIHPAAVSGLMQGFPSSPRLTEALQTWWRERWS